MEPIYYQKQRKRSKGGILLAFLFLGLLFITTFLITKILSAKPQSDEISSEEEFQEEHDVPTPLPMQSPTPTPSEQLGEAVQNALIGTSGSYGVVVINLKTGENYSFNEHVSYTSASLYKLWVMSETFQQIKNGRIKESDVLEDSVSSLNKTFNIDETPTPEDKVIRLTIREALDQMITISDNYAALLLSKKIRLSNASAFLRIYGFDETSLGVNGKLPTTTAHDIALFFERLYKGQIINGEYSDKMLQLLKQQKLNSKLPKYLPQGLIIAHKTGELDEFTHDAGIVYDQKGDYVIVVLSKSSDPQLAASRISDVSEAVYNYFQNQEE